MPRGNPSPKIPVEPSAREALKRRAGLAAVAHWEKDHGRFTEDEMNEARRSVRKQLREARTGRRPA
jgi:hypothetical protein